AVGHAAHRDGIVEVAGGFAIDGDDGHVAVVATMLELPGVNDRLKALRLLQDLDGEAMRQVEFTNDDLDIDAEVVLVTENFDDAPARVLRRRRPICDLHLDDDPFKIGPVRAAGLFAKDAVTGCFAGGLLLRLPLNRRPLEWGAQYPAFQLLGRPF